MTKRSDTRRFYLKMRWMDDIVGGNVCSIMGTNSPREMTRFFSYFSMGEMFKRYHQYVQLLDTKEGIQMNTETAEDIKKVKVYLNDCYYQNHNRPMRKGRIKKGDSK